MPVSPERGGFLRILPDFMDSIGISHNSCEIVDFTDFHVDSMFSGEIHAFGPAGRPG